jgi:RimJ/RimL family protein N-acetyltransferase
MNTAANASRISPCQHVWFARDGSPVLFRAIEPSDLELEREFVGSLSRHTSYQRLMSGRTPTAAELQRWTDIDREREGAIIATTSIAGRERQVGVARYAMDSGEDEAEFAIVLGDAWQGRGLGTHLLSSLIDSARLAGVRRLFGTTLSGNAAMLKLGRRLAFKLSRVAGAGYITMMSLDLA